MSSSILKKIKQFIRSILVKFLRDEFANKNDFEQQILNIHNELEQNIRNLQNQFEQQTKTIRNDFEQHIRNIHSMFEQQAKNIHTNNINIEALYNMFKFLNENELKLKFSGQFHQDLIIYLYLCRNKNIQNGFFIDIGANDGITSSNTHFYEKLGWNGICVEPLPDKFITLRENRNCDCYNVAIAEHSQSDQVFINARSPNNDEAGCNMLSGLESSMTEKHKQFIKDNGGNMEYITVQTMTFDDLMLNYPEITYIDFLSVDVEGGELNVLKSINFNKFSFGLIILENNEEIPGNGEILKNFMSGNGYKVLLYLEYDIIFVPIK
jgi:FkbM family methyltransferase